MGKQIKKIVQELNVPIACLDKEKMEALELFENHEQVKEIKHCKYLYVWYYLCEITQSWKWAKITCCK